MDVMFLTQFFGIFLTVMALSTFFHREKTVSAFQSATTHPAMMRLASIFPLMFGLFIVLNFNRWGFGLPVVLTLTGWYLTLVGVYRLWFSDLWVHMIKEHGTHVVALHALIQLVLGVLLVYLGFFS